MSDLLLKRINPVSIYEEKIIEKDFKITQTANIPDPDFLEFINSKNAKFINTKINQLGESESKNIQSSIEHTTPQRPTGTTTYTTPGQGERKSRHLDIGNDDPKKE
tara:strand:- start:4214 stop:4531 length:318 start_codon:yes stop_codon:yes gene_type:complete